MEEDEESNVERERRSTGSQSNSFNSARSSQDTIFNSCLDFHEVNKEENILIIENQLNQKDCELIRKSYETMHEDLQQDCKLNDQFSDLEDPNLYFRDKIRSIDFVLVYDEFDQDAMIYPHQKYRRKFEENLSAEGLEFEYEQPERNGLCFIKIHAPREVLRRYAEILKLRLPMKDVPQLLRQLPPTRGNVIIDEMNSIFHRLMKRYYVNANIFPTMKHRFNAVYSRDKEYLFDTNSDEFFTSSTKSRIVQFILDRTKFTDDIDEFAFGIDRLISEKAYDSAYPLHDGNLKNEASMRFLLYKEWANVKKCLHYQPLDYVKEYFGVKIGLYFAWLGFYTYMLIPASIVGVLCFLYGCLTLNSNEPSEDICSRNLTIKMCPLCDHYCRYWDLSETCFHARVTYLFDNPATVFFAVFMSIWATLFLELWKKYSAEITHRWDLTSLDVHEEHPRPQYLARLAHVKKKKVNLITNSVEPKVPFWKVKLPATILSFSVILLLIAVAMAAVLGVVLYRVSVLSALSVYGHPSVTSYAIIFTTTTAACINLCCIIVFNWIYIWLAEYLTEIELPRTQTEFDDSLTLKIYLLEFVNYYASIFYIAFFKGKFVGYPGNYNLFFKNRQEECGPGGCLMELCIQLSIIMIGKQAMNTVLEMLFPLFFKWLNTVKVHMNRKEARKGRKHFSRTFLPWVRDYKLVNWGPRSLFPEYLEMVLQYGFVTIFVAAFPLAPFCALINNILEMRLDAKKLLTLYRRPVGQRVRNIGIWYKILDSVSKLSAVTNAFILAFTSNFIPRLVYRLTISKDYSLSGFLQHSLSNFNTSDFKNESRPMIELNNHINNCYYPDYREPPNSVNKYQYTNLFWHILAARLAFVVVFENVVALVMILVRWIIPDMSNSLRKRIRREIYITNEIIIQHEAHRACGRFNVPNNRILPPDSISDLDLEVHLKSNI
ncbi:anoctamin-1-like [Leptopilina heterotoma]|uniref:anoctamin-1-like n=1 Tax=Leptopilina heterotoma TaxID=63436 RepID=UPI001CA86016|nr:anoctamin-1-like [Leptopilina heterotoma]XP_043474465.1 anoctamin-1-like [Leptopilina heterotoma]